METYTNTNGEECVIWTEDDGSMHSMTKAAYDEMIKAQDEAKTI